MKRLHSKHKGRRHHVAICGISRAYGGPEEGGWWYDCSQEVLHQVSARSRSRARRLAQRWEAKLARLRYSRDACPFNISLWDWRLDGSYLRVWVSNEPQRSMRYPHQRYE